MKLVSRIKNCLNWKKKSGLAPDKKENELREFIYLDEVSLRSLLSSLKGEVTDTKTNNKTISSEGKVGGTLGVETPLLAKADLTSHFQTSNSSTIQTSRKATVQSWFAELHKIQDTKLIEIQKHCETAKDLEQLEKEENSSLLMSGIELKRGELIEMRIKLNADQIFKFGTMISEFAGFAEEWPAIAQASMRENSLEEVRGMSKILNRLLTGLIPIRCEAIDYSVIELNGKEYIAHNNYLVDLDIKKRPLIIVAVTEHLAYWKDIRRVLFSDAEFTMLFRIGKQGLQKNWNPIKLGDLFREIAPGMLDQINSATLFPFQSDKHSTLEDTKELLLKNALTIYSKSIFSILSGNIAEEKNSEIENLIDSLKDRATSSEGQRSAFKCLQNHIEKITGIQIKPEQEIKFREAARLTSGLPQFPSLLKNNEQTPNKDSVQNPDNEYRLLDVEVVAIYW